MLIIFFKYSRLTLARRRETFLSTNPEFSVETGRFTRQFQRTPSSGCLHKYDFESSTLFRVFSFCHCLCRQVYFQNRFVCQKMALTIVDYQILSVEKGIRVRNEKLICSLSMSERFIILSWSKRMIRKTFYISRIFFLCAFLKN